MSVVHLGAVAGDQDGPGLRVGLADQPEDGVAVAVGDLHVDQHDLERRLLELLGRLAGRRAPGSTRKPRSRSRSQRLAQRSWSSSTTRTSGWPSASSTKAQELAEVDRLGDDLPGAGGERLLGGRRAGVGGDQQRHRPGALLLDLAVERQAVHAGHLQVQQGDVVGLLPHQLQGRRAVVGEVDPVAQVGEDVAEVAADVRIVVDDEDRGPLSGVVMRGPPSPGAAASRIVKALPCPGSLVTRRVP